ncbi:flagellar hook-associated protein FlgL [Nocardioides yefusunii]|uniref:Flagellar hook-associated protein FlgL n=1 Tax=Nocardioides yefusunii TaxID=2500546 RepID=A0ABW1QZ62_9ACTN|nr:flagellar hook-associated protein FlgL [Nocardioides yefusunii]
MSINRVTQNMVTQRSLQGLQSSAARLAATQEQLTTGKLVNRPSDSPTSTTTSMRLRSNRADAEQFVRNASDGRGWLGQLDTTLQTSLNETRRARELVLQARSGAVTSVSSREALAVEVDQLRESLISLANTTYLGRPVFGGVTAGGVAFDADGTYVGTTTGEVTRTVAEGVTVRVDMDATAVYGPAGANLFADLEAASIAIRTGDDAGLATALDSLAAGMERLTAGLAEVGGRTNRVESSLDKARDRELSLRNQLSELEEVDIARVSMDLALGEVTYQAALSATARVIQPSLLDYLR